MLGDRVATSIMATGLRQEFHTLPKLTMSPSHSLSAESRLQVIRTFVPQLLQEGVLRTEVRHRGLFFSRPFVVQKGIVSILWGYT